MKNKPIIAVLGATGLIGNELVVLLDEKKLSCGGIRLFASEESVGEYYKVGAEEITVELLTENSLEGIDIALCALPPELTLSYIELAKKSGTVFIDLSSASRENASSPLVVNGVNDSLITELTSLISTPRSVVVQLAPIFNAIQKEAKITRVVMSTYQAVSSAGKAAIDELWEQTRAVFTQKEMPNEVFHHQIAFNSVPQIDLITDQGNTREEEGIVRDLRRVLDAPELAMSVTCVRVPVLHSDGLSVNLELAKDISAERVLDILASLPSVQLYRDPSEFPTQIDAANSEEIHVGRVRKDSSVAHGINLWVVGDNIRRGIALNAIEILSGYIQRFSKA